MGEDALRVESSKAVGEASNPGGQQRRPRRPPPYELIEPLRLAQAQGLGRYQQLLAAVPPEQIQNPVIRLPYPQLDIPRPNPVAGGGFREAQGAPRQHVDNPARSREDNRAHRRRLAQQRVVAGRLAGNNSRNPRPAVLLEDPDYTAPRPQGNRGGVTTDPIDREQAYRLRRRVIDPE